MIQFNLLPDVKLEYVRAQRTKRMVITSALMAAGTAFIIFLLLFLVVNVVQSKNIRDLDADITTYNNKLKNTPELAKVLTIQNQLAVLPDLHSEKPAASRTFQYLQQLIPVDVTISEITIDYTANTIAVNGQAKSLDKVNMLVDTLKFTTYTEGTTKDKKAFSDVVMSEFTKTPTATTYGITASFDPVIFDNAVNPKLIVPKLNSTRSVIEQPTELFKKSVVNTNESKR